MHATKQGNAKEEEEQDNWKRRAHFLQPSLCIVVVVVKWAILVESDYMVGESLR